MVQLLLHKAVYRSMIFVFRENKFTGLSELILFVRCAHCIIEFPLFLTLQLVTVLFFFFFCLGTSKTLNLSS